MTTSAQNNDEIAAVVRSIAAAARDASRALATADNDTRNKALSSERSTVSRNVCALGILVSVT